MSEKLAFCRVLGCKEQRHGFVCVHFAKPAWYWKSGDGCAGLCCLDCLHGVVFSWPEDLKITSPKGVTVSRKSDAAKGHLI